MTKIRNIFAAVLITMVYMVAGQAADTGSGEKIGLFETVHITVKETGSVDKERILLKDVADIKAHQFIKTELESLDLGASPKPDQIAVMDRRKIESQIRRLHYLPETVTIACPPKVFVKRTSRIISKEQIRLVVQKMLEIKFQGKEFRLKQMDVRGLEPYPMGDIRLVPDREDIIGRNGRLHGYLDVIVDNKKTDRITLSGEVAVFETAYFAVGTISKNKMVSARDVYEKKVNVFDLKHDAVKDIQKIEGKMAVSDIKKDDCLTSSDLSLPPLVRKGDLIQLVAKNKGLVITTSGVSKEDGVKNQLIRVENLYSGKLVRAVVTQKSRVEVVY